MRPSGVTAVASMVNIAAPDIIICAQCTRCQSVAQPSTAEYWHIGETTMRFASASSRIAIGSKSFIAFPHPPRRRFAGGEGRSMRERRLADVRGVAERFGLVGGFPGELGFVAAEVPVRGGLAVDRPQEVEHPDDALRPQVEMRL